MKRIVSLVLALSMVLSMFSFAFAGTTLPDVDGTNYEAAVSALVELGIVNGYPDGEYKPANEVTRAEMAKFLVVSAGLEPAADVSKGATKFSDVDANHWATGYINVATEYGYINGYPEGTFAPDATVSYAEAVTMAIRVLGFKSVVEAKGTWPTNYIAKAQELKMLKDVKYGKYTDGAIRGNVALLMWNMLRTPMWDVTGENENNGLSYSDTGSDAMIEKYFADYTYAKVKFVDFEIAEGKVVVKLDDAESTTKLEKATKKYYYAEADFFTFVPEAEVEVLVNEETEELLLMIPTGADELVEGTIANLTDEDGLDYTFSGETTGMEYAYGILGRNKVIESSRLLDILSSEYVYEIEENEDKWIKVNDDERFDYDDATDTDRIFVKDGALVSFEDVEEGDVLTKVACHADEYFYVVGGSKVSGKLEAYVANGENVGQIEIDDEEYDIIATATYVVDTTDEDADQDTLLRTSEEHDDMKNEDVDAYLDFFGTVVRVEFDGELGDAEEETSFGFYAVKSWVERASARTYDVILENEDGEDTYVFADDLEARDSALTWMAIQEEDDIRNFYFYVAFNEDGEILYMLPFFMAEEEDLAGEKEGEYTVVYYGELVGEDYDEDKAKFIIDEDNAIKVDGNTYIVTMIEDDEEEGVYVDVTFEKGIEALKNLDDEDNVAVIFEVNSKTITPVAKYVVLYDELNARENDLFALVVDKYIDTVYGNTIVVETEDGDRITYKDVENEIYQAVNVDNIIRYETETDEDGKVSLTAAMEVVNQETYPWAAEVKLVNGLEAVLQVEGQESFVIDMSDEDTVKYYEDYRIIFVNYDYDEDNELYEIESFKEITMDEVKFVKEDLYFDYAEVTPGDELMIILSK